MNLRAGGLLYGIQEEGSPYVKIGYVLDNVPQRLKNLRRVYSPRLDLVALVSVPINVRYVESEVHDYLKPWRVAREWFSLALDQELLEALVRQVIQAPGFR